MKVIQDSKVINRGSEEQFETKPIRKNTPDIENDWLNKSEGSDRESNSGL